MKTKNKNLFLALALLAGIHQSAAQTSFAPPAYYPVGGETFQVTSFTNVDGKVDVASVDGTSILTLLTNNGSGVFAMNVTIDAGIRPVAVTAADVNGDGKVDLIYANINNYGEYAGNNGTLTVLTNDGSGNFTYNATYGVGSYPVSVATADVNNDGRPDLICANFGNYGQGSLSVLTNNGSGGFVTEATINAGDGGGFGPYSVTTADVNRNGWLDLICVNTGPDGSGNTLLVFTNDQNGGFALASTPVVGNGPISVTAADINNDGWVDLICANPGDGSGNTLSVLTNDHSGGFALSSSPVVGTDPGSVVAADVNGDGWVDLICSVESIGLSVLTNNGSGGFALATNIPVAGNSYVVAADINGDGKVDLISTTGNNSLAVVLNTSTPPGPILRIALAGNQSVLFWPESATNYVLQSTTNLTSPNWTIVSDAVPVIAVTVTNVAPVRFFRLSLP